MHVLHVTPYLAPAWAFGPVPQRVFDLARAQRALGVTVTVLTTDAVAPHERLRPGDTTVDGVRIIRVPSLTGALRSWLNLSTPIGIGRQADTIVRRRQPDIVHLHEVHTIENLRVAAVLPRTTCIVLSPHGTVQGATPPWVRRAWHRWGGDALLARTTLVVAASEAEAASLEGLAHGCSCRPSGRPCLCGPEGPRLRQEAATTTLAVVRNGIEVSDSTRTASCAEARARFTLHNGPVVLFAGRLAAASGITGLIDAFIEWRRVAPSAQLLVVGADHGALAEVRARITEGGVDTAVHLAGHLTGRDAQLAFAAADLFAVPGRSDGFPTVWLEALASGLPVLGEPSEVLQAAAEAGVGHVVPVPAGVEVWARALQQAWVEVSERPALRHTARQVASQFGWTAAAAEMVRLYERALLVRP